MRPSGSVLFLRLKSFNFQMQILICILVFFPHALSDTNWIGLRKLEELDVSDNCLSSLPSPVMHCLKSLSVLNVCRNRLSSFPDPWACPLVTTHTNAAANAACFQDIYHFFCVCLYLETFFGFCHIGRCFTLIICHPQVLTFIY